MNQLARAIRNLGEGRKELDPSHLTPLERIALKSIGNLIKMSPVTLAAHLQQEGDPTDWLMDPFAHISAKAVD